MQVRVIRKNFLADENGGKAVMDEWLLENLNVTFDWQYMTGDMTERFKSDVGR